MAAKKPKSMKKRVDELLEKRLVTRAGGGEERLAKQRASGKMTARERIDALIDEGTFQEIGLFRKNRTVTFGMDKIDMPADGVVTGTAAVLGRPVHIASQDFTVVGGSAGETHS
ncbi:MAG TPA: methylmalonyl-CoA carboxyltransferase, partial [Propionibacteriaceae bacterium]|nr:methylmalonyl-CoA carboxyltransferase [Propionibacteriaceae bacterium]